MKNLGEDFQEEKLEEEVWTWSPGKILAWVAVVIVAVVIGLIWWMNSNLITEPPVNTNNNNNITFKTATECYDFCQAKDYCELGTKNAQLLDNGECKCHCVNEQEPVDEWSLYTSEILKVTFRYQPEWFVSYQGFDVLHVMTEENSYGHGRGGGFYVTLMEDSLENFVDNYANEITGDEEIINQETTTFAGQTAIALTGIDRNDEYRHFIFTSFDEQDYLIEYDENNNMHSIILDSFAFLDYSDTSDWQTYENEEADFSFEYPSMTDLDGNSGTIANGLTLSVSVKNIDDLPEVAPLQLDKQSAIDDRELLSQGEFGLISSSSTENSRKVFQIGDHYIKTFAVFGEIEICDVFFRRSVMFYNNNHKVIVSLSGPINEIKMSMPAYFDSSPNSCDPNGNHIDDITYSIWDYESNDNIKSDFFRALENNQGSGIAQEWFDTFEQIVSTLQITDQEIDSDDWQTYINEEYFFAFDYPTSFYLDEDSSDQKLFNSDEGHFWLRIADNEDNLDAQGIMELYYNTVPYGFEYNDSFIDIAGINSYKQTRYDLGIIENYFIPLNDKVFSFSFEFNFNPQDTELFDNYSQIISDVIDSFVFIY